jgi:hypothetical protein
MTLARPPVVSQTEWDAALAAMTEREETVSKRCTGSPPPPRKRQQIEPVLQPNAASSLTPP